jgi:hypothetical protein
VTPTGLLGPLQVAALKAESETAYQGFLAALPASAAPTRMIQAPPPRKAPVVVQKARERAPAPARRGPGAGEDNSAASAAAGAFFGGVASGLLMHGLNH